MPRTVPGLVACADIHHAADCTWLCYIIFIIKQLTDISMMEKDDDVLMDIVC